jgi:hypothetical protein
MLEHYKDQAARVRAGYGYGVGLARTREVGRLAAIIGALELLLKRKGS